MSLTLRHSYTQNVPYFTDLIDFNNVHRRFLPGEKGTSLGGDATYLV
jgi:hypothetical protein